MYRINQLSSEYRSLEKALTHYLKEVNELTTQLDRLKQGKENAFSYAHLSAREIDIVTLLSQGLINKEIAQRLNISVNTVKFHVKNVYSKLKISSRKEIVAKDKLESTLATEH
jgi:DNA-binding CsgD family transcriptional regulator